MKQTFEKIPDETVLTPGREGPETAECAAETAVPPETQALSERKLLEGREETAPGEMPEKTDPQRPEMAEKKEKQPKKTAAEPYRESRKRVPLTHRTGAKVLAFIMVILMAVTAAAGVIGAIVIWEEELYVIPEENYREEAFANLAEGDASHILNLLLNAEEEDVVSYCNWRNISEVSVAIEGERGRKWGLNNEGSKLGHQAYTSQWYWDADGELYRGDGHDPEDYAPWLGESYDLVTITIYVPAALEEQDWYRFADLIISLGYALRYWVYAIIAGAVVIAFVSFLFLMCASGRRAGYDEPQPGWGTWMPVDVLAVGTFTAAVLLMGVIAEAPYQYYVWGQIVIYVVGGLGLLILTIGWCMSMALRFKLGGWWKNSAVWYCLRLCKRILRKLWKAVGAVGNGILTLLRGIPLVWKTAVIFLAFCLAELIVLASSYHIDTIIGFWVLSRPVLFVLVIAAALMLRRLQKGGEALAAGDLSYQVDTKRMLTDFRKHGENLNRIGEGMTAAVEQRMRSERMKTELITNVSHDIKTPLTSIINYADLITQEPCENENIREYAAVLHRQSERLKRLIEDLVEASKLSTGNLEVHLAPCEAGVMLTQAAGEYEHRLAERQLTLVTRQPEQSVRILADGRRLWRVFDNLMNNICKYGQSGTRVYLTLEEKAGQAVITFRNTSREALNLSADELMERFVRGDASRSSDGNGLGLSIARSLTELQKGTMELTVDGDLFKVILRFPVIR